MARAGSILYFSRVKGIKVPKSAANTITDNNDPNFPMNNTGVSCPDVSCPDVSCPSVEDIVGGLFPGRNPGITASGKYHNINAFEEGTLISAYSNYTNLRNDGEDTRLLNSDDPPEDTEEDSLDRMSMGVAASSGASPGSVPSPSSPPVASLTDNAMSPNGVGIMSQTSGADNDTQEPFTPPSSP